MQIFLVLIPFQLFAFGFYWFLNKETSIGLQQAEAFRQQQIDNVRKLDDSLSVWLMTLELPQLEEQTKREVVARQLRTVLIELLLLSQIPDCTPNKS